MLSVCLAAVPARSDPASTPASSESSQDDLSGAEKVAIRVRGYPEITGDYRINADNTVSIPVLGRIAIAGYSAAGLERLLATKVAEVTGKEGFVTVEVILYRPVFVTGIVKNSGAVEWRPGLTVLQAVALAGGLAGRDSANGDRGPTETQVDLWLEDQKRSLATIARLQAEKMGKTSIELPPTLVKIAGRPAAEKLIDAQKSIFTSRANSLSLQLAAIERARTVSQQELDGLRAQNIRVREQLTLRRDQVQRLRELLAKGIIQVDRAYNEEARVSDLEEKQSGVAVAIARIEGIVAGLERDSANLRLSREAEVDAELIKQEAELTKLNIQLGTASANSLNPDSDQNALRYEIVRKSSAGAASMVVDQLTALKPGDVLVVSGRASQGL